MESILEYKKRICITALHKVYVEIPEGYLKEESQVRVEPGIAE